MFLAGCAARISAQPTTHETIAKQAEEQRKTIPLTDEPVEQALLEGTKEGYERLGDQYVRQGNLTQAFAQYDRSLRQDPHQSRVRGKRGLLYVQNGLWHEAQEEFLYILRDDAGYAPAYEGLGQVYLRWGRASEAEKAFRRAVQLNTQLWKAHAFLGILYDSLGKHVEAIAEFQAALVLKPEHRTLVNNLGRAYYSMGHYDDAIQQFRLALQTASSDLQVSNNLALALAKAGRYKEAFDTFQKNGHPGKAYNNLGVMYWDAGKLSKAAACFHRAIEVSPAYDPTAGHNLAAVHSDSSTQLHPKNKTAEYASVLCLPAGAAQRTAGSP